MALEMIISIATHWTLQYLGNTAELLWDLGSIWWNLLSLGNPEGQGSHLALPA